MRSEKRFELFLIAIFLLFSWWLMDKSFGYNPETYQMRIARHQVGDFGLHLSLIRSFSWGNNFPPQSPFFPGKPLPYHYYFDLFVGILERLGVRIDIAFNGLSILVFTALLFLIYKISQLIFEKSKLIGILSIILFIFHSNLTFIDFFRNKPFSIALLRDLWLLPDYIHKGPFDGSLISIFFTLNVFLNQRHLIAGLAISFFILYILLQKLIKGREISMKNLILLGTILGLSSRVHSLIFLSTSVVLLFLFFALRKTRWIVPFFFPAFLLAFPQIWDILHQNPRTVTKNFVNPGFLSERPFSLNHFFQYWTYNLGLAIILIPLGVLLSKTKQRIIFFCFFTLFIIANIFQLSFRIDHNHSLLNHFFIIANFYIAYFLSRLWQRSMLEKVGTIVLVFFLTISGFIDLMAVKNDFRYPVTDTPANRFMQWIKDNTDKDAIFVSRQEIFDPITLSGRSNYFGATYYLSVMGYDYRERADVVKSFFEAGTFEILESMRQKGITYLVIPVKSITDFHYQINQAFLNKNLKVVYSDSDLVVYKL